MNDKQLITMLENQNPDVINQMAGVLLSGWLPDGIVRKILLFGSLVAGIVLAISHGTAWILLCLIAAIFSPRAVGELARMAGRLAGNR